MASPSGRSHLRLYLEALYGRERDAFVEIAHRPAGGTMRRGAKGGLFIPTADLHFAAREIERLGREADVWVGVLARRPDSVTGEIGGAKQFVADGRVLWVDCDFRENPGSERGLREFAPAPQLVVASGGGFHAYWLLAEPLERDWVPIANRRLAHALGSDLGATDLARILRPPGVTRNLKYDPPRPVELAASHDTEPYPVRQLVGGLSDPPGHRNRPRAPFVAAPHIAADPLRAIAPPAYVRALAGSDVPDGGAIVRCPLPDHDDPEPSCQVFADPERGWYCYGCQRGGSIYDFAAHLWGLETAGRDFVALRRELERRFAIDPGEDSPLRQRRPSGPRASARPASFPPASTKAREARRLGGSPTALLERPQSSTRTDSPTLLTLPLSLPLESPRPTEVEPNADRPAPTALPLPVVLPVLKAILVVAVALLGGMGLFVVVFTLIPLGRPTSGELVCAASGEARLEVPARYMRLYRATGRRAGLDWAILAAIGSIESGHGENMGPSSAGALGPMQFMPGTWAAYGVDGDRDGRRDVMDPDDAIPGAARYLKASGAPADWRGALFAYNHAGWYVELVLQEAERYRAACREVHAFSGGSGALGWPLEGPISSPFGMRWGRLHAGIDIAAPLGTPIHAAERGRVALRGPVSGYGNYLCLRHLPRLSTCYAHLSAYRSSLGQVVRRGELIGLVGCTGRCFGPHLHFEVRLGPPWSKPVDPLPYLAGRE